MKEIIRFAWGISSLGDFMVAISDKGIVAVEFSSDHAAIESALEARFPDAVLEHSQEGLTEVATTVAGVIDDPASVCDLPLDLRGTAYEVKVWQMLREIPTGQTTSYGALAARLGTRDSRDVTQAIANNAVAILVPCHRVIKKDGSISGYRWGVRRKRALLAREQGSQAH
ncbi:methylated-DNA--[protein]-cysteine S-methyltransferase [Bosea sp. NPDC003192]|jgi:AraC family transcriptional regulator of adaptative response/methylated-DNA-[protein]-cysteine methyltransferase|uniref:methylated-DNA--[protein]-cysteine S-methyltransferase n=1 Tax=Bosea sp. NPDC003192 TaxID=3390551 RepID=UPI003D07FCEC